MSTSRSQVLSLYRRTLRLARTWQISSERTAIAEEARMLIERNRSVQDKPLIQEHIHEFETRIQVALHYGIAAARPTNVAPGATGKRPVLATPVYLKSYAPSDKRRRGGKVPEY